MPGQISVAINTHTVVSARTAKPEPTPTSDPATTPKPVVIRAGTKQAQVIAMLKRPFGATITEIVEATGWQAHSARGFISGALKKRLGLAIMSRKIERRGTVHLLETS